MYIITFYSFKGGVGRSMAMANVGLSLAREGRRVLLVDFDLEAPGLDTFDLLKPSEPTRGIVDFVTDYRKTRIAPDVAEFIYAPPHPDLQGKVWVMPTGKQDAEYGRKLSSIDWNQLYSEEDGYLFFEDLKEQWKRQIQPDYVLVDSRTGHTDVGGICTRQLPDAVVLLFFPNEQNRRGLEVVVQGINSESRKSGREIELFYVASNVPELDDDENILRSRIAAFERTLNCPTDAIGTVHHYDSMLLLQQTIFTVEKPRTKLAREYEQLARKITSKNLDDQVVVSSFLESVVRGQPQDIVPSQIEERLQSIRERYFADGAILYSLAQANRSLGREKEATALFDQAANLGFLFEEQLADKANHEYAAGSIQSARDLVRKAVKLAGTRVFILEIVLQVVVNCDVLFLRELLSEFPDKEMEPPDRLYLAQRLAARRAALPILEEFLQPLVVSSNERQETARSEQALSLIGQRRYHDAKQLILSGGLTPAEFGIQDSFNYAVATWGESKIVPQDLFEQVVNLDRRSPLVNPGANYLQCLAISNWAIGRTQNARELAAKSRVAKIDPALEFSAWRYLRVPKKDFLRDLDALDQMITGNKSQPEIINEFDAPEGEAQPNGLSQ